MSKKTYLTLSTAISAAMALLFIGAMLWAKFTSSENQDLGEGLGRVLIMIFALIALIYVGVDLIFKIINVIVQKNVITVFITLIDIAGIVILLVSLLSSVTDASYEFSAQFFIDAIPLFILMAAQCFAIVFDIRSFRAPKI